MEEKLFDKGQLTELLSEIESWAEYSAAFTFLFLREKCRVAGIKVEGEWPQFFLEETAAVLELGQWQESGQIPENLKSFAPWQDIFRELLKSAAETPPADSTHGMSALQLEVFRAWFESSAWDAKRLLGVPILVERVDDERLLDQFASLLWNHRHLARGKER